MPATRYARHLRCTTAVADEPDEGHEVVVEGLGGRVTAVDDPTDPRLNAARYLPSALASHLPLILMLGTNDEKRHLDRSAFDIATGIGILAGQVLTLNGVGTAYPAPKLLLVAPPPLGEIPDPWIRGDARGRPGEDRATRRVVRGFAFFDAGLVIAIDGADGIHLSEQNNLDLGRALAPRVRGLLT